jgi:hypothetical protein
MEFKTYEDLFNHLIRVESDNKTLLASFQDGRTSEMNHVSAADEEKVKNDKRKPYTKGPPQKFQKRKSQFTKSAGETRTCYRCGLKGHLANKCHADEKTIADFKKCAWAEVSIFAKANIHFVSAASAVKSAPLMTPICSKKVLV